jgi:hypothetical protein
MLDVRWDQEYNWHENPTYQVQVLPIIADGGDLADLTAANGELLKSDPPGKNGDDNDPLGFQRSKNGRPAAT